MADPNRLVAEYTGYSAPGGTIYNQTYISVQEYRDGKMILFREYWNAVVVRDTFGDLSALAGCTGFSSNSGSVTQQVGESCTRRGAGSAGRRGGRRHRRPPPG